MGKIVRIARSGGIPATAHITKHADRLKNIAITFAIGAKYEW